MTEPAGTPTRSTATFPAARAAGDPATATTPRLRVLELIKGLAVGGSETLLLSRLRVADRARFDYSVGYLQPDRADLVPALTDLGVAVVCFPSSSAADWRWTANLRRYVARERPDLVHVHSPLVAAGVRLVVRSLGRDRPALMTTEHGLGIHRLTELAGVVTVRADDLVIAVSEGIRDTRICRASGEVDVIHHGVDVDRLRRLRAERDSLAAGFRLDGGPRIVTVANFRRDKGHPLLLQTARLVHQRYPSAHFYVAGHGPLESRVRAEVTVNRMDGYFHILGRIPDAARLSVCADLFVLCSETEGRPVALMEAMAAGVPAVATAVGGVPEVVTHGLSGLLVRYGDAQALASAIGTVLSDAPLREVLSRGALDAARSFDIRDAARRIEQHYVRLAARRTAAHR